MVIEHFPAWKFLSFYFSPLIFLNSVYGGGSITVGSFEFAIFLHKYDLKQIENPKAWIRQKYSIIKEKYSILQKAKVCKLFASGHSTFFCQDFDMAIPKH